VILPCPRLEDVTELMPGRNGSGFCGKVDRNLFCVLPLPHFIGGKNLGFLKGVLGGMGFVVGIIVVFVIILALIFGGSDDSGSLGSSGSTYTVKVNYPGSWSGSIGGAGNSKTVDGYGSKSLTVEGWPAVAVIQKQDGDSRTMGVEIWKGDKMLNSGSTSAAYGVVSVSS